jgi:hypothetical protein
VSELKIAVGLPSSGKVHILWAYMFSQLQWPVSAERNTMVLVKVPIATARNNIALSAIQRDCKYLFFFDDDVLMPNFAPKRMIYLMEQNDDWDALTGVYVTKTTPPEPLLFGGEPGTVGAYWDWRMGEIFPVWGAGLGCCVVRVDALKKMEEPYFAFGEQSDGVSSSTEGEDLFFFRKLAEQGGTMMADGSILCGHMDRDSDKIYSLWKDSKPYKNAIPEFLEDPLAGSVPEDAVTSVIAKPK